MRLAWFRALALAADPTTAVDTLLDDTGLLIRELASRHTIDVFTETTAHDVVWKHFRYPYDLSVVELGNTTADAVVNDPTGTSGQQDPAINSDGRGGAIVTWDDSRDGHQSKIYAQRYFGDGPTPVLVSLVSVEALPDRVTLTWHDAGRTLTDAAVHRRGDGEAWVRLGPTTFDGTGRARFEDREAAAGTRYAYRLGWIEADGERFSGEAWVEVPRALTLALEGARPNPASGPLQVAFALPQSAPATLELLDVAGRQVLAREVGSLGPGQHVIRLGECGCTPPGIYWLRLTQAGCQLTRRAVIVR